ncbi:MAG: MATE family efflux transporter [Nannocystaceae bacterium]
MATPGYRALLSLAWPIVLARSAQAVIGFSDAAMVAPLGEDALAATTAAATNTMAAFILPMGIVFIVQSFAAQLAGKGDLDGARRYAYYALLLAAFTLVVGGALIPGVGPVVAQLGFTPEVRALMATYMTIRFLAAGAVVGVEGLGNWYAGLGDTRVAMVTNLIAMVVNVFLNWVLIYGNLGAPALGVEGAAWASVLASWASFVAVAGYFAIDRGRRVMAELAANPDAEAPVAEELPPELAAELERDDGDGRLSLAEFRRMIRFGLPNGFNWFLEFSAFLVFINVLFADLGTAAVAALMAVIQVNSVSFMPAFGLATAGAILVGQAIGRGAQLDVPRIVARTISVMMTWQGLVGLSYLLIPSTLMAVFASDPERASESAVTTLGATLLAISAAWQLFDAIVMGLSEALRAAGDTAWCLWARVACAWLLWLPATFVVLRVYDGGAPAAIWCMVAYFVALTGVVGWRFRSGAWRQINLTGGASA